MDMFGFADRGNINNANPVWVMFWYNCIDTFVNGKRTQTNKRLLMRLKRWKTTQTGTFTGLKIQGELWHPTMKGDTKWNDLRALFIQYLLRDQWTSSVGQMLHNLDALKAIFVWPSKMVSASVRYLFYQPMDEKIKTWPLRSPAKQNPNMEKALFDWQIVLQYDVKAKYQVDFQKVLDHEVFWPERLIDQPKATRVCIRSINQSSRISSVRSLFSVLFARFHFQVIRKSPPRPQTPMYWNELDLLWPFWSLIQSHKRQKIFRSALL